MAIRLTQDERTARTRTRLLTAATRVFARDGMADASVDTVAAAAGYSKGAIYANFPTKNDLVIGTVDAVVTDVSNKIAAAVTEGRSPIAAYCAALGPDEAGLLAEYAVYARHHPKLRRHLAAHSDALATALSGGRSPALGHLALVLGRALAVLDAHQPEVARHRDVTSEIRRLDDALRTRIRPRRTAAKKPSKATSTPRRETAS